MNADTEAPKPKTYDQIIHQKGYFYQCQDSGRRGKKKREMTRETGRADLRLKKF